MSPLPVITTISLIEDPCEPGGWFWSVHCGAGYPTYSGHFTLAWEAIPGSAMQHWTGHAHSIPVSP